MAQWIPTNKKTGMVYPAISDEEKAAYLADPLLSTKYNFQLVPGSEKPKVAPPIEAKKFEEQVK